MIISIKGQLDENEKILKDTFINVLRKKGVDVQEFETSLESFYYDEAEYRIRQFCDDKDMDEEQINQLIKNYRNELAENFFNNDQIICSEELEDTTSDTLEQCITLINNKEEK